MTDASAAIEAYLARLPADQRDALNRLRRQIAAAAPEATEVITYAMPGFHHNGALVAHSAFKNHCSLFPMGATVLDGMAAEIAPYRTAKGTLHFTPEAPLPEELVQKIVAARLAENAERATKRKARRRSS